MYERETKFLLFFFSGGGEVWWGGGGGGITGNREQDKTCLKVRGRLEVPAAAIVKRKIKFSAIHNLCN